MCYFIPVRVLNLQCVLAQVDMFILLEVCMFLQLHTLLSTYVFVFCLSATATWYCLVTPKMRDGFLLKTFPILCLPAS